LGLSFNLISFYLDMPELFGELVGSFVSCKVLRGCPN